MPLKFKVRKAREEDIPEVMKINMESLPENYWYGFYKHILDNWGEAFLVAEVYGELAGYAMSRVEDQGDPVLLGYESDIEESGEKSFMRKLFKALRMTELKPVGHLVSIAVRPQYRRIGIGSKLLEETIKVMKDFYKTESIYLEVRISNTPAIKLYEKFGFKKARIVKGYYADGEDAYIMVKKLR